LANIELFQRVLISNEVVVLSVMSDYAPNVITMFVN